MRRTESLIKVNYIGSLGIARAERHIETNKIILHLFPMLSAQCNENNIK